MKSVICGAILACLVAFPAASAGFLYDCDITNRSKKVDWLSPKLAIIAKADGSYEALDSVTLHFTSKAAPARARKRGNILILRWTLKGAKDSAEVKVPAFDYEARLNTKSGAVTYSAHPVGFQQLWTGKGTCKKRKK